jgi:hypothetical protein
MLKNNNQRSSFHLKDFKIVRDGLLRINEID